ncbi:MAG TPA: S53 family peptidase [Gammaproteobacteria bacterium]|nr:S53 family peptidase [Gammaproteobacteria bacterium]
MKIGTRLVNTGLAAAVTGALLGSLVPVVGASASAMVQVEHNVPRALNSATFIGHHDPKAMLHISVALSLHNTDGLAAFMHDVANPRSRNYRKFLTPRQFTARYCPSAVQVRAVEQFLRQRGITVGSVSPNNMRIHASASTAAMESAFGVAINDYKRADGTTFYSASTDPSFPANVSGYVKAVFGLDDAVQYRSHAILNDHPEAVSGPTPAGFSPQQIATAYDWPSNAKPALTDTTLASGMTIAIATAYSYRLADVEKFWSTYKLPTHTISNVAVDGNTARLEGETTLDIERSSAMSPGSSIVVFKAFNPSDPVFDDMFNAIANYNSTPAGTAHPINVMSTSWGQSENTSSPASLAAEHDDFVQMAAEGIMMMAAAGDNSADDGQGPGLDNADFPASDPYVLAAGGTHLVLDGNNNISSESVWFGGASDGTGGADSLYFAQPYYQTDLTSGWTVNTHCDNDHSGDGGSVAPNLGSDGCAAASNASRQSSDMAMDADPATGYSVYFNGRWAVYGGTSFVAPELAGFYAVLVKSMGTPPVSAPALVYCDASLGSYSSDFHDIQTGTNSDSLGGTFDSSLTPGWDHPTGWGTPDANSFITDIQSIAGTCPLPPP